MEGKGPRILERAPLYQGKAFSVYKYTVLFKERRFSREIIERRDGAVLVPVDKDLNVLLISEYCAGSNSFVLSLPGGSIEDDESPEQSAVRELREETGYRAKQLFKLQFAYTHPSTSNRRSHAFLAYDLVLDPLPKSAEIIDVIKMPLQAAIKSVYEDFVSDVSTVGNLLMARDKLVEVGILASP
jgi:ADP-ribose pyrophosphatase